MTWWRRIRERWQRDRLLRREGFLVFCPCETTDRHPLNARPAIGAVCGFYEYECETCGGISEFDFVHYPVPVLVRHTPDGRVTEKEETKP